MYSHHNINYQACC